MTVVVVDDGELSRDCLAHRLSAHDIDAAQAWDMPSLMREVSGRADAMIVLLNIDSRDSGSLLQMSLDLQPRPTVIVFGLCEGREEQIVACAEAGVDGMHLRTESFASLLSLVADVGAERCSPTIAAILMRRVYAFTNAATSETNLDALTARENEILDLLAEGLTNQQIASRLYVTVFTVKNHVHSVLTKLGVKSRGEAVAVLQAIRYSSDGRR